MQKKQLCLMVLACLVLIVTSGCVIAAVGAGAAGTVAYIRGDLESVEAESLDKVYSASVQAVEQLELAMVSKQKDALSAEIIARDAQDKKIRIKLAATAEGTTKLSIRIGTFGSETKSRMIYEKIKENL